MKFFEVQCGCQICQLLREPLMVLKNEIFDLWVRRSGIETCCHRTEQVQLPDHLFFSWVRKCQMPEVDQSAPGCPELCVLHLEPLESLSLHCTAATWNSVQNRGQNAGGGTVGGAQWDKCLGRESEQTKSARGAVMSHPARPEVECSISGTPSHTS